MTTGHPPAEPVSTTVSAGGEENPIMSIATADLEVIDLVAGASSGDSRAWDALVDRYAPLVWSICRKYRLDRADADDVAQSVWLHLVDHLDQLRDAAALPGWLATTTRRECWRVMRTSPAPHMIFFEPNADHRRDEQSGAPDQHLLEAERRAAVREAFTQLPREGQALIAMLIADPPLPYAEISAKLGLPVGSIGPTRSRYLDKIRRYPAIAALIDAA
jgi:RNA polymerase sigma factor (sigma-70 family)